MSFAAVLLHPTDHVPDPKTRDHLHKRIDPEAEERDRFVFIPKEDRDYPFDEVIENGNESEGVCPFVKGFPLRVRAESNCFHAQILAYSVAAQRTTKGEHYMKLPYSSCVNIDYLSVIKLHYYMYKETRIRALPAAFMLVSFLFVSFFGFEGTLLCFGEDGHVAIEFVNACKGAGVGSQLAGTESDACGPCKDVQFLNSPACTRNVSYYTQALPLMFSSPLSPSFSSKEHPGDYISPPQYSPHKTLASLHSIVLLI